MERGEGAFCDGCYLSGLHQISEGVVGMSMRKCAILSRADNLVLVKFGFSALSAGPSFFRRLVLDLVLKTSNSACSFSAPEIQQTLCQMMMIGKTTCSGSFHWKKWTDLQHLERLQHQKCCTIWPSGSRLTEACKLFLRSSAPKCHRDLQSWSVLTSNLTW